ncbi:hypothetical protein SESBI_24802 [Sesbania bispinosa]|nr:hypothetical protein SESBI_24802 [Sesbania bispinosa]
MSSLSSPVTQRCHKAVCGRKVLLGGTNLKHDAHVILLPTGNSTNEGLEE